MVDKKTQKNCGNLTNNKKNIVYNCKFRIYTLQLRKEKEILEELHMKISTKGIYALEVVVDLARHSSSESLESLKNIAGRRQLSEKYLERIVKGLKEHEIVQSVRGAYGGYCLAREASMITAKDVLLAVEGKLAPVDCLIHDSQCGMQFEDCSTREIWLRMWEGILEVTEGVTIRDIMDEAQKESVN